MSSTSYYDTGSTVCLPGRNIKVSNITACQDVAVEGELSAPTIVDVVTINGSPYPPGIPLPQPFIPNKVLRTNNTATQALWGDVPQGTSKQVLHTNVAGTAAEWTTNLSVPGNLDTDLNLTVTGSSDLKDNVHCEKDVGIDQDLTVTGTTQLGVTDVTDTLNVQADLQFVGVSGSIGDVLIKTGANTQAFGPLVVPSTAITPGLANQVFVTNGAATAAIWSSSVTIPANLTVTSTTNLLGNLQMSGVSGAADYVLTKTGATTQAWLPPAQIKNIRYSTYIAAQDLNVVGPTAITFETSPYTNIATASRGVLTGISQPDATQFTIGESGLYDIYINGFIDPTSTGPVSSLVTLSLAINGSEQSLTCIVVNNFSFIGYFNNVSLSAGQNVTILARRNIGTGTFLTFASGLAAPSFSSTIAFVLTNNIA